MRWSVALLVIVLAGCSAKDGGTGHDDGGPSEGAGGAGPGGPDAPAEPAAPANVTALQVHWVNGTFQNVGQCIVWQQAEIDGIDWHELPENASGAPYETTVDAAVGPPPAVIGATGACLTFDTGNTSPLGGSVGETRPLKGEVPDGAVRVGMLTDAAVDGTFSIRIVIP